MPRSIATSHARSSAIASSGPRSAPRAAVPDVALCDHALDDLQDGRRVGPGVPFARPSDRIASAIAAWVHFAALPCAP